MSSQRRLRRQIERDNLDDLIADFERVNGPADPDAVVDKQSRLGVGISGVIPDMA
ncbi:hypothetical protein ACTWPB_12310 [Nocardia sp. IBHARD005]|uniref:hypothetical protein n=1 Tax=Nocardia sp. IBHARD005 TaxID=3457765 RepID=UPI0040588ADD